MAEKKKTTKKNVEEQEIKRKKKSNKKKKLTKKQKRFIFTLIFLLIIAIVAFIFKDQIASFINNQSSDEKPSNEETIKVEGHTYDDLQFHFMELGVYETGDSTYIKAGETDILIDAGASSSSIPTLIAYINNYCTDGKLEYVITTHAHADHYAGMFGKKQDGKNFKGEDIEYTGLMYYYEIETIIDFSQSEKKLSEVSTGSDFYKYHQARDYAVSKGAKRYGADECFNKENGASSTYILDEEKNITMDILYNKYYFNESSDENDHSVCTMFNYNDHHFMLTGDLEKDGEEALAAYYDGSTKEKTLPQVELFKAGHHGSATSSNECLLSLIQPKICTVCCCAGSSEYTNNNDTTFPTQAFIDRISKYTDSVYVTSQLDNKASREQGEQIFKPLNGTIIISSNGTQVGLAATNNLTKLKDSEWFNETIYVKQETNSKDEIINKICSGVKKKDYYLSTDEGVTAITRRIWPNA